MRRSRSRKGLRDRKQEMLDLLAGISKHKENIPVKRKEGIMSVDKAKLW